MFILSLPYIPCSSFSSCPQNVPQSVRSKFCPRLCIICGWHIPWISFNLAYKASFRDARLKRERWSIVCPAERPSVWIVSFLIISSILCLSSLMPLTSNWKLNLKVCGIQVKHFWLLCIFGIAKVGDFGWCWRSRLISLATSGMHEAHWGE